MRCFVVGNGPSLAQTNLDLLSDEYSFGVNAVHQIYHRTTWRPSVLVIGDVSRGHAEWINERRADPELLLDRRTLRFLHCVSHNPQADIRVRKDYDTWAGKLWRRLEYFDICSHHNLGYPYDWSKAPAGWHPPQFCRWGGGVGMALQMAVLEGYAPIYVLGCDLGYVAGTANHFAPNYGDPIVDYRAQALNMVLDYAHRIAFREAKERGVEIFNAAPGGALEAYPRVRLEEII
jgi:hypothetical protein